MNVINLGWHSTSASADSFVIEQVDNRGSEAQALSHITLPQYTIYNHGIRSNR